MAHHRRSGQVATTPGVAPLAEASRGEFAGFDALQLWMSRSLLSAQNGAGWMQEVQRQNMQAATLWVETLAMGVRDAQQATGVADLLAVPTRMMNRQLECGFRRYGENVQNVLDSELRWIDDWRERALAGARDLTAASLPDSEAGQEALPLWAHWARALGAWQEATRRLAASTLEPTRA